MPILEFASFGEKAADEAISLIPVVIRLNPIRGAALEQCASEHVGVTPCDERSCDGTPTVCSNSEIAYETAGCVIAI